MFFTKRLLIAAATPVWVLGVLAGLGWLGLYAREKGDQHVLSPEGAAWMEARRSTGRPLLVMAVHPRCPCSAASLAELGDLLARSRGGCDALLLEYAPPEPLRWSAPSAFRELGGVSVPVIPDTEGRLAAYLGALTSGHTVVLDEHGAVRFQGGLTGSRGHRGRSPAQDAILASISGRTHPTTNAPVYGCRLGETACPPEFCHADH